MLSPFGPSSSGAEHSLGKREVAGSSPASGSLFCGYGSMVERWTASPEAAGSSPATRSHGWCLLRGGSSAGESAGLAYQRSWVQIPSAPLMVVSCGRSSIGRASAFHAECCEFDSRRPLSRWLGFWIGVTGRRGEDASLTRRRCGVRLPGDPSGRAWPGGEVARYAACEWFESARVHAVCSGAVAQLARASAWHAGGRGFKSHLLHLRDRQQPTGGQKIMSKLTMPRGVRWYSAEESLRRGLLHRPDR